MTKPIRAFTFPAGESHIKADVGFDANNYDYHVADIRGHDPQDLFHLAMWEKSLPDDAKKIVFLPYIPGARADRGTPFGAQVYADFFNNLFIDQFIVLDPHSPVAPKLFDNSEVLGGNNVTEFPFERIIKNEVQDGSSGSRAQPYVGVIAPDAGAKDRAQRAATVMGVPVYTAGKTRDFDTGALTGFYMDDELPSEGRFLIVGDICDGGGETFFCLANVIKKATPNVVLDLWVSHGVFSDGFGLLAQKFETVHTTDSFYQPHQKTPRPTDMRFLKGHSITPYLYAEAERFAQEEWTNK